MRLQMQANKNYIEVLKELREDSYGLRVLLVEDDDLIRNEYKNFFGRIFQNIDVRENGQEGLDAYLQNSYDIIITDVQMPVLNGLEMLERIKEHNPKQHCLLISAHQEAEYLQQAVRIGVDGYLFKPMNVECSVQAIHKIISQILMERENTEFKNSLVELVEKKSKDLLKSYLQDSVSKLYSLAKLQEDLQTNKHSSLAIFKIKNFKSLNDFHGYEVGDKLLEQTANIMKKVLHFEVGEDESYALYRISGAHFALLAPENEKMLLFIAKKIILTYETTEIDVNNNPMYMEMNGAIVCHKDGVTLSKADTVLRQAEQSGKIVVYKKDEAQEKEHQSRLLCNDSIKRALQDDRFVPFYQPIVCNETNTIYKYEALARLILPDGEIITPNCFLPVSKKTKTYNMITRSIIKKALKDFAHSECCVSVNISIDDIKHEPTADYILKEVCLFPDPSRIVFELLESENIDSYTKVKTFFNKVKKIGCKVAIDDFGSGYSNFEHIAKLNVDYIKIDGSLISGIHHDKNSYRIVEMLSGFTKQMGIKTIAEYVSSSDIKDVVNALEISESQGYLFGKPVAYDDLMLSIKKVGI